METFRERLKIYALWATISGTAFFAVYPTCNWITAQRSHHLRLYADWELGIPFWPQWIWVYVSMYVLFLVPPLFLDCASLRRLGKVLTATTLAAGVAFLAFPATLGFQRVAPESGFLRSFYLRMFEVDQPHNLVPSLHIVWSTGMAWALVDKGGWPLRVFFGGWAVAIACSTLLVHQHHLIDVVTAVVFVIVGRIMIRE